MKFSRIVLLSILFISTNAQAQFRKYSNEFLNIGAGARGLAMGSSQIASVQDAYAGYWNPGALSQVNTSPNVAYMHANYFAGIGKYDFVSLALPTKNYKKTLGLTFLRFAVDDIPNTLYLVNPDGSLDYNNISSFSSADAAVMLSYSQKIKETKTSLFSLGGNIKIINRKVGSFASAWGFGFDFGAIYHKKDWKFGAVLRDATTTFNAWSFTFSEREKEILYLTKNEIPTSSTELTAPRLILGAGKNFQLNKKIGLYAESNLNMTFDGKRNALVSSSILNIEPSIGLEANYEKTIFVRAGASNFQRGLADGDTTNQKKVWIFQPSIGVGFLLKDIDIFKNVGIDYAFTNLANQSNPLYTHVFSIKVDLAKSKKKSASSTPAKKQAIKRRR